MMASRAFTHPAPTKQPGQTAAPNLHLIALLVAGALVGLGVVLWIAANWQEFGKAGRFALVAAIVLASAIASSRSPRLRAPAALPGILAIGGLFALLGQTYQSSANAYELFAIWAAVALPWVIAARHDAVWSLWIMIAFTALPLWLSTLGSLSWSVNDVAPVWAIAIVLSVLLSPSVGTNRWIGRTRWAFRLAVTLTLVLIVSYTLPAIFTTKFDTALTALIGCALVGAAVAAFVTMQPFSLALLAASVLACDVLAISWLTRAFVHSNSSTGGLLLLGLLSAGVVAASATALLNFAQLKNSVVSAIKGPMSTWPVAVLSGIGALLASLPLLAFLGMAFGTFLATGYGAYIIGGIIMAGSMATMHGAAAISFRQQLAFIGLVVGMLVLSFAIFRDMPESAAAFVMMLASTFLAAALQVRWISVLLGAAAAGFFIFLMTRLLVGDPGFIFHMYVFQVLPYLMAGTVGSLALIACDHVRKGPDGAASNAAIERAQGYLTGWSSAVLTGLMIGNPTFLLGSGWNKMANVLAQSLPVDWSPATAKIYAVLLVLASLAYLTSRVSSWRTVPGYAIGAVIVILSYVQPAIAAAFIIFSVAVATERRALAALAALALVWLVGSFYYWLGWPLVAKAYLLGGLGTTLGVILWLATDRRALLPAVRLDHLTSASGTGPAFAALMIASTVLTTATAVGAGIWQKEDIIRNGRTVFLPLAPVDPRSLMRGDYMALRFKTPRLPQRNRKAPTSETLIWAGATLDSNNVATIQSYAADGSTGIAGDIVLRIKIEGRQVIVGTNAYFFPEGQAQKYAKARFGEFRVGPGGDPILVGLADQNFARIN